MTAAAELTPQNSAGHHFRYWLPAFAISLAVSLLMVAPFFTRGVASGHDFEFHATSWLDVSSQWKEGIVYPRWTEWANHGFGEPRFIFYPPLSWMLGSALSFLARWDYVPAVFIILVQTFAGVAAFAFARRLVSERAALFAALFYAANPNALLMIYFRSDFAELLASAFFPLLFLAALQLTELIEPNESIAHKSDRRRAFAFFAAMFAVVWLSNAPAAVMATYSVTLLFFCAAFVAKSWRPLIAGAGGMALGFALAAVYIVPAAYEQRWVDIAQALAPGLLPADNFLYTAGNDPEHTWFNYIASTVAVVVIVMTGLAAIAARRQNLAQGRNTRSESLWRMFLLLAVVSTALMLRPSLFVWHELPKLRFVQFPWRWMSIVTIPLTYFLAVAVRRGWLRWLWMAVVGAALLGSAMFLIQRTWWDDEEFSTLITAINHGEGFDGTDEYDPISDDHYNLPQKAQAITILPGLAGSQSIQLQRETKIFFDEWTPETRVFHVYAPEPLRLALRLLIYPAWRVEINGSVVKPETADDTGQMILSVPAGESRVTVRFTRTPDRTVGGIVSLAGLAILGGLVLRRRRLRPLPFS